MPTANLGFNFLIQVLSNLQKFATIVLSSVIFVLVMLLKKNPFTVVFIWFEQGIETNTYGQPTTLIGVTLSLTQLEKMY